MPTTEEVIADVTLEVKRIGGDAKKLNDSIQVDLAAIRKDIEDAGKKMDPLLNEKLTAFGTGITEKMELAQKAHNDRMDAIEVAVKRSGGALNAPEDQKALRDNAIIFTKSCMIMRGEKDVPAHLDDDKIDFDGFKAYRKGFATYMRTKDDRSLTADTFKSLSSGSDPDGGYMIEPTVSARIIEKVWESSPLRRLATVETISGTELEIKMDTDETDFEWVGETDLPNANKTPQLGKKRIICHTMAARPKATQQLLEDASVDMAGWLARKVGEKFARGEATGFFTGTGRGMPRGILTYDKVAGDNVGEKVGFMPSGTNAGFTFEAIINAIYSLKESYSQRASWLMKRTTIPKALTIKDGEGRYLFSILLNPGQKGLAASLAGYPLDMAADMPDLVANSIGALFGDFNSAYTIVDRLGITTLRDPYTVKPFVEFYTRKRVGGDVVNFESFKYIVGQNG